MFACVRVASETLASCPLEIYKRLPDGGRERARDFPLYDVLHNRPNVWQTAFEWVEMMQAHIELRGNAYSRILPGPRGVIDALVPMHPDRVQVKQLDSGRLQYEVSSTNGLATTKLTQDQVLHIRGLSSDGIYGMSFISAASNVIRKGLAQQDFETSFLGNNATPGGVLKVPQSLSTEKYNEFRKQWEEYQAGKNRGKTAILPNGMEYQAIGITNKDSQLLESTNATREEICGMARIPPHKISMLERSTNNNIEHQGIEFVTDSMSARANRFEKRVNVDLIQPLAEIYGDGYFSEFNLDALLRGDLKSRYESYSLARQAGFMNGDIIASKENLPKIPAEQGGADYWRPSNMVPAGSPVPAPAPAPTTDDEPDSSDARIAKDMGVLL